MKKISIIIILAFSMIVSFTYCLAETIYGDGGGIIRGKIIRETDDAVEIELKENKTIEIIHKGGIYAIDNRIIGTHMTPGYWAKIKGRVLDGTTKLPIENAIVFMDRGYYVSYTDKKGNFTIPSIGFIPCGHHGVIATKKGYSQENKKVDFKVGENGYIDVYITPEYEIKKIKVKGEIHKLVFAKGSKSEYSYYVIRDNYKEMVIFNEVGFSEDFENSEGRNMGFEEFNEKKVVVEGYINKGYIGWMMESRTGIYVEKIYLNNE